MRLYRYAGIPATFSEEVRRTLRSPQYGHPAYRERATGTGPCRSCLRTFVVGEEDRILFTYQPFSDPDCLPAPGPVFVHAEQCERYDALSAPSDLTELPLVLEAHGRGGALLRRERVSDDLEASVDRLFDETNAGYLHIRNAEAGCFITRVDRCFVGD